MRGHMRGVSDRARSVSASRRTAWFTTPPYRTRRRDRYTETPMDGITLSLLGIAVVGGIALFARATYRRRRLPLADIGVRCPENDCPATVTVRTDPAARTGAEYVEVVACSRR